MKIYLARHGETIYSSQRIIQGQKDSALTKKGVLQIRKLARLFKNIKINKIYSSPLQRALITAAFIHSETKVPVTVDERLKEIYCGTLEGISKNEADPKYGWIVKEKEKNRYLFCYPRGESYKDVEERLIPFVKTKIQNESSEANLLIVAHKVVNRILMRLLGNLSIEEMFQIDFPNDIIYAVEDGIISHSFLNRVDFRSGILRKQSTTVKKSPLELEKKHPKTLNKKVVQKYLLRIGIHSACNQQCIYCNRYGLFNDKEILTDNDLIEILKAASFLGFERIHLTGGEPLLRSSLSSILEAVEPQEPIKYYLTTNGSLLYKYAKKLSENGVKRVNVSLDSLNPQTQKRIARVSTLKKVLKGLKASKGLFESLKLNMIVLREYNMDEIEDFIDFCQDNEIILRLMELIPFSISEQPHNFFPRNHVSKKELEEILGGIGKIIPAKNIEGNNWACDYWMIEGKRIPVGVVHHHTRGYFCVKDKCNSIRISAGGAIASCYTQGFPTENIKGLSFEEKIEKIRNAILMKEAFKKGKIEYPQYHLPDYKFFRANIKS